MNRPIDPLVAYLTDGLRAHGVPVSPAEVIDAHRAHAIVGVADRGACTAALRATLVKHAAHDGVFDRLLAALDATDLALGFGDVAAADGPAVAVDLEDGTERGAPLPDEAERLRISDRDADSADAPGDVAVGRDDPDSLADSAGLDGVEVADAGADTGPDATSHRLVVRPRTSSEYALEPEARREVERVVREYVRARRGAARRWSVADRGRLDVRRTLRASQRTGGVPMQLSRRGRTRPSPRVVVLADVSISVRPTARLALHAADAMTRCTRGVRLVVFVDRAVDATAIVRRLAPEAVVAELVDGGVVDVSAASDYGRALRSARDLLGSRIDSSTVVVVFGDGRSNGADPGLDVIDRWCQIANAVEWCTPEPPGAWPLGFGEMQAYADSGVTARTVRDLDDLAAALAPRSGD